MYGASERTLTKNYYVNSERSAPYPPYKISLHVVWLKVCLKNIPHQSRFLLFFGLNYTRLHKMVVVNICLIGLY